MKRFVLVLFLLLVVAAGAGAWFYTRRRSAVQGLRRGGAVRRDPAGLRIRGDRAGGSLTPASSQDVNSFRLALWVTGPGGGCRRASTASIGRCRRAQVADKIARGDVYVRPITFPEGLTIRQMAALYESRGSARRRRSSPRPGTRRWCSDLDPDAKDLEGYLFPDTYALPRRATAEQLVARMVAGFTKALTPDIDRHGATARGLTVRQLVTLASIVEKETGTRPERPLVAAVYANRLKIGMGLQCDPTVIYALERAGRYDGNLTARGPAVRFALQHLPLRRPAARTDRLTRPRLARGRRRARATCRTCTSSARTTARTRSPTTLDEHNRNVHEYQVKYFGPAIEAAPQIEFIRIASAPPHLSFSRSTSK